MADHAKGDREFRSALAKLASDQQYRDRAQDRPELIETDFKLTVKELQALRQVAVMSGADIRAVDALRGDRIAERAKAAAGQSDWWDDWDWDISCCSSCCCGETAVLAV